VTALSGSPVDAVVVGSGAAGLAAAIAAADAGCEVLLVEKATAVGGTTAKSGGVFWIPANRHQRDLGIADPPELALRYMARVAAPDRYRPDAEHLGLTPWEHDLLEAYYGTASGALDYLEGLDALRSTAENAIGFPDYHTYLPEQGGVRARALCPADDLGRPAGGAELIAQLERGARRLDVRILTGCRFVDLVVADGAVRGVVVRTPEGAEEQVSSRRGVVLALGGFTHGREHRERWLPARVWGGCASGTNTGDALPVLEKLGIPLHNMDCAWWDQVAVEHTLGPSTETRAGMWVAPGDSSLVVDAAGQRVGNEKTVYNERAKLHMAPDAPGLVFLLFDERTRAQFGTEQFAYPLAAEGEPDSHILHADSWEALAAALDARLADLGDRIGGVRLVPDFSTALHKTVGRYNELAATGQDLDFGRGEREIERFFSGAARPGGGPNPTMAPLAESGPYHAVIVGLGTLDTKGGPRTDRNGRVLDGNGVAVPGLYAAGNCAASPANDGYWAAGATIGPALVFGVAAGRHLAQQP
jgi:3-oxosteroid 1-dehydrogenase